MNRVPWLVEFAKRVTSALRATDNIYDHGVATGDRAACAAGWLGILEIAILEVFR